MLCGMGLHEMPAVGPVQDCLHLIAFAEGILTFTTCAFSVWAYGSI